MPPVCRTGHRDSQLQGWLRQRQLSLSSNNHPAHYPLLVLAKRGRVIRKYPTWQGVSSSYRSDRWCSSAVFEKTCWYLLARRASWWWIGIVCYVYIVTACYHVGPSLNVIKPLNFLVGSVPAVSSCPQTGCWFV